jgi:hypothetical protein
VFGFIDVIGSSKKLTGTGQCLNQREIGGSKINNVFFGGLQMVPSQSLGGDGNLRNKTKYSATQIANNESATHSLRYTECGDLIREGKASK